jgi:uncharacterized coiled-coil protein SlyX
MDKHPITINKSTFKEYGSENDFIQVISNIANESKEDFNKKVIDMVNKNDIDIRKIITSLKIESLKLGDVNFSKACGDLEYMISNNSWDAIEKIIPDFLIYYSLFREECCKMKESNTLNNQKIIEAINIVDLSKLDEDILEHIREFQEEIYKEVNELLTEVQERKALSKERIEFLLNKLKIVSSNFNTEYLMIMVENLESQTKETQSNEAWKIICESSSQIQKFLDLLYEKCQKAYEGFNNALNKDVSKPKRKEDYKSTTSICKYYLRFIFFTSS